MLDDRLHHFQCQLHRYREADALGTARLGNDGGIDADQVAAGIHQRAARVAAVDRRIGLDEILVGVQAQLIAAGGADDAHGDGLADAEGVADRQGDVADAYAIGMAERDGRQVCEVDLQHGKVGLRIAANHPGQRFPAILEGHDDLLGVGGHMVVGEQVAFGTHDYRRTEARLHAPLPRQVVTEEALKQRVLGQRLLLGLLDDLGGVEVGNCWRSGRHRVGVRIRALLRCAGNQRCLLQPDVVLLDTHQLRIALDDQQCYEQADQQRPAEKT